VRDFCDFKGGRDELALGRIWEGREGVAIEFVTGKGLSVEGSISHMAIPFPTPSGNGLLFVIIKRKERKRK